MKKLFLITVCALCTLTMSAQSVDGKSTSLFSYEKSNEKVRFGLRGGIDFAIQTGDNYEYKEGVVIGLSLEIPFKKSLYFQTGLYYQDRGYYNSHYIDRKRRDSYYIELPILASYRYNFDRSLQLQVNFGPYVAYGIAGDKSNYFYDFEDRIDFGVQPGVGLTIAKHFYVGASYDLGLYSPNRGKHRVLMMGVGVNF